MKFLLKIVLASVFAISPLLAHKESAKVQLALLLDTSGSMEGLINQAKSELWSVVNEFSRSKNNGVMPKLEVALYEYGKSSVPAKHGYIRRISHFSTDLDKLSEELFALRTNGGEEYCGQAIATSLKELEWSQSKNDYRVIFIAGNEAFTQGSEHYSEACHEAKTKGIVINTIFCGQYNQGVGMKWMDGAKIAGGDYHSINSDHQKKYIHAPQDDEITRLGQKINDTYIYYGKEGKKNFKRQSDQDLNAKKTSRGSLLSRSFSKSTKLYKNESWDLVDKVKDVEDLDEIEEESLSKELQEMSKEDVFKKIETKRKERDIIKKRINELHAERKAWIAKEQKSTAEEGDETLGAAMIKTVRNQAESLGFNFSN